MKISGSGSISAGEYNEEVSVSGSGKVNGNIKCTQFTCTGAAKIDGDIVCDGALKASGAVNIAGSASVGEVKISGSGSVGGGLSSEGNVFVSGSVGVGGGLKCASLSSSGVLTVGEGIEAEEICHSGALKCGGLVNAERIELKLDRCDNRALSIGGSEIKIEPRRTGAVVNKVPFFVKLTGSPLGTLTVEESIEGDSIYLSQVKCPSVVGRTVNIGAGCVIDRVRYSESINVDPNAKVGVSEKM